MEAAAAPHFAVMTPFKQFQTPELELTERLNTMRAPRSRVGLDLDQVLADMFTATRRNLGFVSTDDPRLAAQLEAQSRTFLQSCLHIPTAADSPLQATLLSTREEAFGTVEEVEFTGVPPMRIPATVVVPRNGRTRHPAVVALHSMGGLRLYGREKLLAGLDDNAVLSAYRKENYSGRSVQGELAKRGYLSIAIDAFNFGLRTADACEDRLAFRQRRAKMDATAAAEWSSHTARLDEEAAERALRTVGYSVAALVATDDVRTVDYLCSREDVDSDRIACGGLSFGSFRTHYLAALDSRVRAAFSICWISTLDGIVDYNIRGSMGFFALPPDAYRHMDMVDIVALAAPKPFLAISGWKDCLMQPAGIARAHLQLRAHWQQKQASGNLGSLVYDTGHEFNATMQDVVFDFLDQHLPG